MTDTERARQRLAWPGRYWLIALGGGLLIVLLWIGAATDIMRSRRLTLAYNDHELSSLVSALAAGRRIHLGPDIRVGARSGAQANIAR
jgi:hypothetical protein